MAAQKRTEVGRSEGRTVGPDGRPAPDAADQLRTVMRADFKPQRLLNKSEARLFKAIDRQVLEARPGWQVMAQVSLGEILRCEDKDAYACINSKRIDLLIVDEDVPLAMPAAAQAPLQVSAPAPMQVQASH